MWGILIAGVLSLLSSCNFFYVGNDAGNNEAVVLYQKDSLFAAKTFPFVFQCRPGEKEIQLYNHKKTATLILENPKTISMPDGVYELYISGRPLQASSLFPSNTNFVTTLDFYSFTAPEAKTRIEADITRQLSKILMQKDNPISLYIIIKFGAIKLADGTYSTDAGSFNFSGIKIIQTEK